jgi:hypothetical protein
MNSKLVGMSVSEMAAYRSPKRRKWPHQLKVSLAHSAIGYQLVIITQPSKDPSIRMKPPIVSFFDRQPPSYVGQVRAG